MDHLEHIHGKLLAEDGEKVLLDEVDGYMGWHPKRDGTLSYFGFFDVPYAASKRFDDKAMYRLVLDDGRVGDIYADVRPCQLKGTLVAEFHVNGPLEVPVVA
jgi:hypothetical protein